MNLPRLVVLFLALSLFDAAAQGPVSLGRVTTTRPAVVNLDNTVTLRGEVSADSSNIRVGFQIRQAGRKTFDRVNRPWLEIIGGASATHEFSFNLQLQPDTQYEFRAVSIVRGVVRYGNIET